MKKRKYNNSKRIQNKYEADVKLFQWIKGIYFATGRMPTLVEQGEAFGYTKERARQVREDLVKRGWIVRDKKAFVRWRRVYRINEKFFDL